MLSHAMAFFIPLTGYRGIQSGVDAIAVLVSVGCGMVGGEIST